VGSVVCGSGAARLVVELPAACVWGGVLWAGGCRRRSTFGPAGRAHPRTRPHRAACPRSRAQVSDWEVGHTRRIRTHPTHNTCTYTYTCAFTCPYTSRTHAQAPAIKTQMCAHSRAHVRAHTQTHALAHAQKHSHSHAHARTRANGHARTTARSDSSPIAAGGVGAPVRVHPRLCSAVCPVRRLPPSSCNTAHPRVPHTPCGQARVQAWDRRGGRDESVWTA
jgi:hypothetical protein